jgi:competence protein ComEA
VSLSAPHADHDGGPTLGALDRLGELADRIGVTVPTLLLGSLGTAAASLVLYLTFAAPPSTPAELTIPHAAPATVASVPTTVADTPNTTAQVTVHAAGAVRHPGLYVLAEGARVADVVSAAGGPLPDADLERVNLAAPVADGARVYVPAVGQEAPPPVVTGDVGGAPVGDAGVDPGRLIDLNRATAAQLEALPGIGPATAAAIIEHRERNGPFVRVDDLLAVRGIGEAKLAALRDRVHV